MHSYINYISAFVICDKIIATIDSDSVVTNDTLCNHFIIIVLDTIILSNLLPLYCRGLIVVF